MRHDKVQAALDEERGEVNRPYDGFTYSPPESSQIYGLSALSDLENIRRQHLRIRLSFHANTPQIRLWDNKQSNYRSIATALGGNSSFWEISGFHICKHGLVVEYLNVRSKTIHQLATAAIAELDKFDGPDEAYDIRHDQLLTGIYQQTARRLVLTGDFQAEPIYLNRAGWDHSKSTCLVFSTKTAIRIVNIEDGHKKDKTVFDRTDRNRPPRQIIYV